MNAALDTVVLEQSKAAALATRGQEAWKYTNLSPLLDAAWEISESFAADELPERSLFPFYDGEKAAEIIFLNGRLIKEWSQLALADVEIKLLNDARPTDGSGGANKSEGPLQLELNSNLKQDAVSIRFAPGTVLKKPVVISQFSFGTENLAKFSVAAPRIEIFVGAGAEVSLVELVGGQGRTIHLPVTKIEIAKSARVSHGRFNLSQESGSQLGYTKISLARDAFAETFQFTLSGRLNREDLVVHLNEPGAEAVLDGLYLLDGKRHVDHSTSVEHFAPHTSSSQLYKGILNDESRAVFNGRVHIHRAAQQSTAAQLNNNLILSKRAEIDTKPELEIDADDVKASHGATIGQIDPDHVFYLRARGIPEKDAVKMLSKGFAQDVAFHIQSDGLRLSAQAIVATALAKSEELHGT